PKGTILFGQKGQSRVAFPHAPYSFGFCERYPDGNTGIVGGLLYHGNPDESFAVIMERFHGWSIHT
ncbi:DUF4120 family protein, partial [Phocaeicola coprophilus]|uniref:DUF4120 family protein n=1 Tax=Phocaeicola coprophilus TaxID=387090 RepID=UPI00266C8F04